MAEGRAELTVKTVGMVLAEEEAEATPQERFIPEAQEQTPVKMAEVAVHLIPLPLAQVAVAEALLMQETMLQAEVVEQAVLV
jgi:predicted Co/Zn/Cd cation transporter (cation efflux family)